MAQCGGEHSERELGGGKGIEAKMSFQTFQTQVCTQSIL